MSLMKERESIPFSLHAERMDDHKRPKPAKPNELWETDLDYVFCGIDGWAFLFNVIDVVSREWLSYVFDTSATKENAILSSLARVTAMRLVP